MLFALFASCDSSDTEETFKLKLAEGQASELTFDADETQGEVRFAAAASWSAWTESSIDGDRDETAWLRLDVTRGEAGGNTVSFSMEPNTTGQPRTERIIIVCEDTRLTVTVTQAADNGGNKPEQPGSGFVEATCTTHYADSYDDGSGTATVYMLEYENGKPQRMRTSWREYIPQAAGVRQTLRGHLHRTPHGRNSQDSYCTVSQQFDFNWTVSDVTIDMTESLEYYPSGDTEAGETSRHYARFNGTAVTEGWFRWDEDEQRTDWALSYDEEGRIRSSRENDGGSGWSVYSFYWTDNNLTLIDCAEWGQVSMKYGNPALQNLHAELDLNWLLPMELEVYDFAAGDITRLYPACGLTGKTSGLLITEITEKMNGDGTRTYRMNYRENTPERTLVTVSEYYNGTLRVYHEWEIVYHNVK